VERVLILGAGFSGLGLATRLSEEIPDAVEVTLIDQSESFVFGYSKLDVMFGREKPESVHMYYRDIVKPSVDFRHETVRSIDPATTRVATDGGTYDADVLVIALGADVLSRTATSSTRSPARSACATSWRRSIPATRSSACWGRSTSVPPRPTKPR
jgi:NADH dehydrogenase FAD-containing subunit